MTSPATPLEERTLYRIATRADWAAAEACGVYRGAAHDARDGFIHLSARGQVEGTLATHYTDRSGLVLLEIDAAAVGGAVRFEPSRRGELFPHLYGALPIGAVRRVRDIPVDGPALSGSGA